MRTTSRAAKFIGSASEIAHYYGFKPLGEVAPEMTGAKARQLTMADAFAACAGKVAADTPEPILAFYASHAAGLPDSVAPVRETGEFSLQIVGCPSSLSEIHILKTLEAIVTEAGGAITCARINSLGDRDSRARFSRELGSFLRRHMSQLESALDVSERNALLENPLRAYHATHPALAELMADAPRPVHYLSEKSRTHFRQVLEHLERVNFPYMIDDQLVAPGSRASAESEAEPRVIFRLELQDDAGVLTASLGGRYDDLAAKPGVRSTTPTVHASLRFRTKVPLTGAALRTPTSRPKIYFIQFGDSAKLTGFSVIDTLRRARIPVGSQFDARHLAPQLTAAQSIGVPYVLIMGAREALDQTVIIRTLATSAQTTVSIAELPRHLRALKLV